MRRRQQCLPMLCPCARMQSSVPRGGGAGSDGGPAPGPASDCLAARTKARDGGVWGPCSRGSRGQPGRVVGLWGLRRWARASRLATCSLHDLNRIKPGRGPGGRGWSLGGGGLVSVEPPAPSVCPGCHTLSKAKKCHSGWSAVSGSSVL